MSQQQLSERQREVLAAIVLNYVLTGSPVGSRTVSKARQDGLSPASIRNTMADLEEMGFLAQPHTSAGRIPTDLGYRFYVDSLMSEQPLSLSEVATIREALLSDQVPDVNELMSRTVKLLAALSSHVGVVLAPRFEHAVLRRLEFLGLPENRILAIFVSQTGMVDHRVLQMTEPFTDSDLTSMTNMVNASFQGLTLPEIRQRVLRMMQEEKALYDRLLSRALSLSRRYLEERRGGGNELLLDGTANVVGEPDFADAHRMRGLFAAFEDKGRLVRLLNACLDQDRTRILIGSECLDPGFSDLTLISSPYHYRQRAVGAVGVIGPRRMRYDRLVTLVDSLSHFLSESLARRAAATGEEAVAVDAGGSAGDGMEDSDER